VTRLLPSQVVSDNLRQAPGPEHLAVPGPSPDHNVGRLLPFRHPRFDPWDRSVDLSPDLPRSPGGLRLPDVQPW